MAKLLGTARGVATTVISELGKFLKAPWKVTGPMAAHDFLPSLEKAGTSRAIGPASRPLVAIIPHAEPAAVYDIAYFKRSSSRPSYLNHRIEAVDPSMPFPPPPAASESAAEGFVAPAPPQLSAEGSLPPTAGSYYKLIMGKYVHINDAPGGGYT
eukprot:TRINITY_DN27165_c0_g1_i1.p1 TRINITY_DN27165_c0_g1~~TRINITY_DN27165_c0_g1_i1.p1  ORF type:complete len:181 (-),score=7.84 TRINITY_DN27165_c0_g1_i1:536-1000(-)